MTNGRKTRCKKKENWKNLKVLELLNDEQSRKQENDEREDVKTQNSFVCDKKTQMRNKATKFAIGTKKKTFS